MSAFSLACCLLTSLLLIDLVKKIVKFLADTVSDGRFISVSGLIIEMHQKLRK